MEDLFYTVDKFGFWDFVHNFRCLANVTYWDQQIEPPIPFPVGFLLFPFDRIQQRDHLNDPSFQTDADAYFSKRTKSPRVESQRFLHTML